MDEFAVGLARCTVEGQAQEGEGFVVVRRGEIRCEDRWRVGQGCQELCCVVYQYLNLAIGGSLLAGWKGFALTLGSASAVQSDHAARWKGTRWKFREA